MTAWPPSVLPQKFVSNFWDKQATRFKCLVARLPRNSCNEFRGRDTRRWPATLAAAALAAGLAGGASAAAPVPPQVAQAEPPILLIPPQDEPTAPTGAGEPAAIDLGRAPEGIEVNTLAAEATDYAGVLEPASGGFGAAMWAGTDRALVERLLPRLPGATASAAMRDLARRLLLSAAEAPAGPGAGRDLMQLRVERLAALGNRHDLAALLGLMPERQDDAATARLRLEALWLAGDADAACAEAESRIRQFDRDVYWQKALIFCQARAGEKDRAALGLDLLREQGSDEDRAFVALVEALGAGRAAAVEAVTPATGLELAMLRAFGQPLSAAAAESSDPAILAAVVESPDADPAVRLDAAERAVAAGALAPDKLVALYAQEPTQPAELDSALSLAETDTGPHGRAVLYQAAARALQPASRAAVLRRALELARRQGGLANAARVHLPALVEVAPAQELAWFAGDAGRALYIVGRYELAAEWLAVARAQAAGDPAAAAAVPALALLAEIAGAGPGLAEYSAEASATAAVEVGSVVAWLEPRIAAGDADARRHAARLLAISEAFGAPPTAWRNLLDVPPPGDDPAPDAALWFGLGEAAAAGRVGETVLLTLLNLGAAGPAAADPITLVRVLESLRRVGLEAEARALALEVAIAAGV